MMAVQDYVDDDETQGEEKNTDWGPEGSGREGEEEGEEGEEGARMQGISEAEARELDSRFLDLLQLLVRR